MFGSTNTVTTRAMEPDLFSSENNHELEWNDFINGQNITFDDLNRDDARKIAAILSEPSPYNELYAFFNLGGNFTRFAQGACCAFQMALITREQVSTLLVLRTILINPAFSLQIMPLLDNNNQFTPAGKDLLPIFLDAREQDSFLKHLQDIPASERYFLTLIITGDDVSNPGIQGLLNLTVGSIAKKSSAIHIQQHIVGAENFRVELESEQTPSQTITIFCLGAENALTKTKYGKHAKKLFPALGRFTTDDIERSMRNHGRYQALSYPGIQDETSFHDVTANIFWLIHHDGAHRRLTSTISNVLYDAFLHAIDVIRQATKIKWSLEIWSCIDMEIGIFLQNTLERLDDPSLMVINEDFVKLLAAKVYSTEEQLGLFTPSPYIDTTWLLLIDMVLNADTWKNLSIDPTFFPPQSEYKHLYDFAVLHREKLNQLTSSPAHQVAFIKAQYFSVEYDVKAQYTLEKSQKKPRYIRLMVDGKPHLVNKEKIIEFIRKNEYEYSNLSPLLTRPSLFEIPILTFDQLLLLPATTLKIIVIRDGIIELLKKKILTLDDLKDASLMEIFENAEIAKLILNEQLTLNMLKIFPFYMIQRLKDGNLSHLIALNKLSLVELQTFPSVVIDILKNYNICSLIRDEKLNINQFKELPVTILHNLENYNIGNFLKNDLLTIDQLKEFSPEMRKVFEGEYLYSLVKAKIITIEQIKDLPPAIVSNLNNYNLYYLLISDTITMDTLKSLTPDIIKIIKEISMSISNNEMIQLAKIAIGKNIQTPSLTQTPFNHFRPHHNETIKPVAENSIERKLN